MQISRLFILTMFLATSFTSQAEEVVNVRTECNQGIYEQPKGIFALHVFCDHALGTNVAVYINDLGAPLLGNYDLGKRFWQGEEWNYDVTSFSWLRENHLLLATSAIYGSGKVYLLNLENQSFAVVKESVDDICLMHLKAVENKKAEIGLTDCETLKEEIIEIAL